MAVSKQIFGINAFTTFDVRYKRILLIKIVEQIFCRKLFFLQYFLFCFKERESISKISTFRVSSHVCTVGRKYMKNEKKCLEYLKNVVPSRVKN